MGGTVGTILESTSTIGVGISMKLLEIVWADCQNTTLDLRLKPSQQVLKAAAASHGSKKSGH